MRGTLATPASQEAFTESIPADQWRQDPAHGTPLERGVILSFDVEEHFRIEAAAGLEVDPHLRAHYGQRLEVSVQWLLEQLAERETRATFFIVGQIARDNPRLVRAIHKAGHEVASHSWDHQRVHQFTRETFRADIRRSKDILEHVTGAAVIGYRAPTFSIVSRTCWALDVLAEEGFLYDSSIFPIWHDRYGVPGAPRVPFWAVGRERRILEFPPATWRLLGHNLPVGGGGYFRLLPLFLMRQGIKQLQRQRVPPVAMLYFHPWEFDPCQARLPLGRLNSFRTYVGLPRAPLKLMNLLRGHRFIQAASAARVLTAHADDLEHYRLVP